MKIWSARGKRAERSKSGSEDSHRGYGTIEDGSRRLERDSIGLLDTGRGRLGFLIAEGCLLGWRRSNIVFLVVLCLQTSFATARAKANIAITATLPCIFRCLGERRITGDVDVYSNFDTNSMETLDSCLELIDDPYRPFSILYHPNKDDVAERNTLGGRAVSNVEQDGKNEGHPGGAGNQDGGVKGREVGVRGSIWAVNEG